MKHHDIGLSTFLDQASFKGKNSEPYKKSFYIFLALTLLYSLGLYWFLHGLPLMQPDSGTYITFSSCRTVGYPFILWLIKHIFGTLEVMPIIHLLLLSLGMAYLASSFFQLTRRYGLTLLLLAGLMANPLHDHAFHILTEPISLTLTMIFMGTAIRFFQKPSLARLLLLSFIAGGAILIRPVHYVYLPVVVIMGLVTPFSSSVRLLPRIGASLTPLFLVLLVGCLGQYGKNGICQLETFGPFNMIGKVSLIADKDTPSRHPDLMKEMGEFAEPIQKYLAQTPSLRLHYLLAAPYYDYFRHVHLGKLSRRVPTSDLIYSQTSWDIIKHYPDLYLKDVWRNFWALWQLYDNQTRAEKEALKAFLDSHSPSPYMPYPWYPRLDNLPLRHHYLLVWGTRLSLFGIFLGGLLMILGGLYQALKKQALSPLLLTGATAALTTQGHFLLTALTQAGLARYSLALWPTIVMSGVVMLEMGRRTWKGHHE